MRPVAPLAMLLASALPALGQEVIAAPGRLSDNDFFRATACAAAPGGDCAHPFYRWDASRPIRVALRRIDPAYLGRPRLRAQAALERAIQAVNAADVGLRLAPVAADANAEIEIFFLDLAPGAAIAGTGIDGVDGARLGPASTRLEVAPDGGAISRAAIVFSTGVATEDYEARMLAELTQALGLTASLTGLAYQVSSVRAEPPRATRLGAQDIMALRRLYSGRDTQ